MRFGHAPLKESSLYANLVTYFNDLVDTNLSLIYADEMAGRQHSQKQKNQLRKYSLLLVIFIIAWITFTYLNLPDCKDLKSRNPEKSNLMLLRLEEAANSGKPYSLKHQWVKLSNISDSLIRAVVASEDFGFFGHRGFDIQEFKYAIYDAVTKFRLPRGASTITQQLAKNLFLSNDWSLTRKIKEAFIANRLENELTKKRILELYLNYIEWGNGIFGAEAASRYYFNIPASDVNYEQALFLAAKLPSPLNGDTPSNVSKRMKVRINSIRKRLVHLRIPAS